jgi:hypothetical protein
LLKDFLAKYVTALEHPTFSSGVAPARFYLLPRLKSLLKGRRNCDDTEIKNTTEELKGFHKMVMFLTPSQSLA